MVWCIFVIGCVATPILFPVISACVLYPYMSVFNRALCAIWLFIMPLVHATLLYMQMDLALVQALPVVKIAGRQLDGTTWGGEAYGIKSDLLTSIPSARSDSLFVHAMMFMGIVGMNGVFCLTALRDPPVAVKDMIPSVQRLTAAVLILFFACMLLPVLMVFIGTQNALDSFHVAIFVIVHLGYTSLRVLVNAPSQAKSE